MGYTTDFEGQFTLNKPLLYVHQQYLRAFAKTRRMRRDPRKASTMPDPWREAVGLPIGVEGGYFVGGTGMAGQDHDASILDYNREPDEQPGLWCQWIPTDDGMGIKWDGGEKFYHYTEWLNYLIEHFFTRWGYVISGQVAYSGESRRDVGHVKIVDGRAIQVGAK